jgi:6-pyruvoyltetrahydropterin/6-carboxytetrahydropterin synthase
MFNISVVDRFSASHFIEGVKGDCANMHGHNWKVEVLTKGFSELDSVGTVMDLKILKKSLRKVLLRLDHVCLNSVLGSENPTPEILARWIFTELEKDEVPVMTVVVWETEDAWASYTA